MPTRPAAKEPDKVPRGLLDSIEDLGSRRRRKPARKARPDELDLDRIG